LIFDEVVICEQSSCWGKDCPWTRKRYILSRASLTVLIAAQLAEG
jgi:hypothetical protein